MVIFLFSSGVAIVFYGAVLGATLPHWSNSDVFFTKMSANKYYLSGVAQSSHVYRLWALDLHKSGYPKAASFRYSQALGLYDKVIIKAAREGDFTKAVNITDDREFRRFPIPFLLRRDRAYWNMQIGRYKEAKIELNELLVIAPDDPVVKSLLTDPRL